MPKRAMSQRLAAVQIISMAQQASPKVAGQRLFLRPQSTSFSRVVVKTLYPRCSSIPIPVLQKAVFGFSFLVLGLRPGTIDLALLSLPQNPKPKTQNLLYHSHSRAPLPQTYTRPTAMMPMNTSISTNPNQPRGLNTTAQG